MNNVNTTIITDNYLYADWPFIITDPLKDWPRDVEGKLLLSLEKIKQVGTCISLICESINKKFMIIKVYFHQNKMVP